MVIGHWDLVIPLIVREGGCEISGLGPSVPPVLQVIVYHAAERRHELLHLAPGHVTGDLHDDLDPQLLFSLGSLRFRHPTPPFAVWDEKPPPAAGVSSSVPVVLCISHVSGGSGEGT